MMFAVLVLLFFMTFTVALAAVYVAARALERRQVSPDGTDSSGSGAWFEELPGIFKSDALSTISFWDVLLKRLNFSALLKARLAQAELSWSAGRVTLAMLLCGTVALALVWRISIIPYWLAFIAVPAGLLAPYWYILSVRNRRFRRFQTLFPDALDSLARALRAGSTVAAGLDIVADETEAPVSTEIRRTFVEVNLGMSWDRALQNLVERLPLPEVSLFVAALQIHSRSGGRLGDVMSRLSESMREQISLTGEIRSIAAHGKLTGVILTLVPVGIALMMLMLSPGYIAVLLNHPYGGHLISAAVVCLVLAHVIIQKLVDIEI